MKRVHINFTVADLDRWVGFYTTLFGTGPTVPKQDYGEDLGPETGAPAATA